MSRLIWDRDESTFVALAAQCPPPVPFSCGFGNARRGSREVKRSGTQRDARATVQGGVFFPNRADSSGATNRPL